MAALHLEDLALWTTETEEEYKKSHQQKSFCHHHILGCHKGKYLTLLYIFVKLLYIGNLSFQFFLMNAYLHGTSYWYGMELAYNLSIGKTWEEIGHFPRVTLCDFEIRVLGNEHRHTVQCVLQINRLNDKIYAFLWFWFAVLMLLTTWSCLNWIVKTQFGSRRVAYVQQLLEYNGTLTPGVNYAQVKYRVGDFVLMKLRQDGVFLLQLIEHNSRPLTATELVSRLWNHYEKQTRLNSMVIMVDGQPPLRPPRNNRQKFASLLAPSTTTSTIATDANKQRLITQKDRVVWESEDQV